MSLLGALFAGDEPKGGAQGTSAASARELPPKPADPRPASKLAGLINQASLCYMNSLIQVMFMTPELRAEIYKLNFQELGVTVRGCACPNVLLSFADCFFCFFSPLFLFLSRPFLCF